MKRILLIGILFIQYMVAKAGDGEYAVSNIPADLLKNAAAVKRKEEIRFDLDNINKPRFYKKYAITILNENGDKFAAFYKQYGKFQEVISIEGALYDDKGKKIKSLRKDDISDRSSVGEENLIDDTRLKYHNFFWKNYPYTIEYEYEIKFNTSAFFPEWMPQEGYNYAVQQSSITVVFPSSYTIRYKAFNYQGEPDKSDNKGNHIYTWQVKNMMPIEKEYASPSYEYLTTMVLFAPSQFQMDNYQGDMSTWETWGKFINTLKQNRDELPDDVKKDVHQLTDGLKDTRQKIKVLYEYLQKNTRYISIQLGIGGWQPFDAKYVAAKKYGDCKALSNYMYSLLKEAGIHSYYAEIKAGEDEDDIITDFPCHQFNHATLCVPVEHDSIWLECTSQTVPAGYIGGFTGNRHALLMNENGGKIVTTTRYSMNDNLAQRKISATLDNDGKLDFITNTQFRALEQDNLHELINYYSKEKMLGYLKKAIDLPTYDIVKFNYTEDRQSIPSIYESIEITAPNYAQVTGKRLFINPNIVNRISIKLKTDEERKYNIELKDEHRDIDSVEIKIPSGYEPEAVPQDVKIESKFGKYFSSVKVTDDKITYYRMHEQYSGNFPASDYAELVKYYEQLYKADHNKVVLVKKVSG